MTDEQRLDYRCATCALGFSTAEQRGAHYRQAHPDRPTAPEVMRRRPFWRRLRANLKEEAKGLLQDDPDGRWGRSQWGP